MRGFLRFSSFLSFPALSDFVWIRRFSDFSLIKGKYIGICVADFFFLVTRLAINHHGMPFVIALFSPLIVAVTLLVTSFDYLYPAV